MMFAAISFVAFALGLLVVRKVRAGRCRDLAQNGAEIVQMGVVQPARIDMRFRPRLCTDSGTILAGEAVWPDMQQGWAGDRTGQELADMLHQSLSALRGWREAGGQIRTLTLLLSEAHLACPELVELVEWELDRQDLPSTCFGIALHDVQPVGGTESRRVSARILSNLLRLASLGCAIELDEFGFGSITAETEASLLGTSLPGDRIRIAHGLTQGCDYAVGQQRMILAVLALAKREGLETIARDISTLTEQSFLTQIGVDWLQGNVIGPLVSREAFLELLYDHLNPVRVPLQRVG